MPASASVAVRGIARSDPASSWVLTAQLAFQMGASNYADAGLIFRDSVGAKFVTLRLDNSVAQWRLTTWSGYTAAVANIASLGLYARPGVWQIRVTKTSATSWDFAVSVDGGRSWLSVTTAYNIQTYIGTAPDQIGFYGMNSNSVAVPVTCDYFRFR